MARRLRFLSASGQHPGRWFWRTNTGSELDYIEESGGTLSAWEFKWNKKKHRPPKTWIQEYSSQVTPINRDNFLGFVGV